MCRSNGKLGAEGTCDAAQEASGCGSAAIAAMVGEWWLHRKMHQLGWEIRP